MAALGESLKDEKYIQELEEQILQLKEKYLMLESVIENSTDAIQISDHNQTTLKVNRAYEILTGMTREEIVGRPVQELVDNLLISESCCAIVGKTRKPHTIMQAFYRTGRVAHVSCTPIFDQNNNIKYYVCNDRDLDEIRKLQTELYEVQKLNDRYQSEIEALKSEILCKGSIIAEDKKMIMTLATALRVAKVDVTVLLLGETGVGKGELAHFIHKNSNRAGEPFISVNCGAITETLFESEFFGYEPNSFTGAGNKRKLGLLEIASNGTLFLDEIGELSLNMQTKLLHVLQSNTFMRVGGSKMIQTNTRILAATNQDLVEMVREKKFREDLYYRLNVIPIRIPPLRERKADIIPLANHFVNHYNKKYSLHKKISPQICYSLSKYEWPGNVRELKNLIEQSVIMAEGDTISAISIAEDILHLDGYAILPQEKTRLSDLLGKIEFDYLNQAYERFGNIRAAALFLGMSPSTFQRHFFELKQKYSK